MHSNEAIITSIELLKLCFWRKGLNHISVKLDLSGSLQVKHHPCLKSFTHLYNSESARREQAGMSILQVTTQKTLTKGQMSNECFIR